MKKVNIADVKTHLSALLEAVSGGERVVICKRNRPVAELVPAGAARTGPRPIGGSKGLFSIPPAFFAPLPDEVLDAFDAPAYAATARGTSRVAEGGVLTGAGGRRTRPGPPKPREGGRTRR